LKIERNGRNKKASDLTPEVRGFELERIPVT